MDRKRVFISSAFRGEEKFINLMVVEEFCRYAIQKNFAPFAPHLFYPTIIPVERTLTDDDGFECGLEWLSACHEMWVCGKVSEGMKEEMRHAERFHIPMQFFDVNHVIYKQVKEKAVARAKDMYEILGS